MAQPVYLIGGFLGSGKTTFLQHLLGGSHGKKFAVLVNDFGELSIDADLISSVNDDTIELKNGCICCSVRGDLLIAARRLQLRGPEFDGLVVEASGISRPEAIARTFESAEFGQHFFISTMISLVDCDQFETLDFDDGELALDQAGVADIVLLNKTDLAGPEKVRRVRATIEEALPQGRIVETTMAKVPLDVVFDFEGGRQRSGDRTSRVIDDHFEALFWQGDLPLDLDLLRGELERLPISVYRLKGFVFCKEDPIERHLVQVVGRRGSIEPSGTWSAAPGNSLVAIVRRGTLSSEDLGAHLEAAQVREVMSK